MTKKMKKAARGAWACLLAICMMATSMSVGKMVAKAETKTYYVYGQYGELTTEEDSSRGTVVVIETEDITGVSYSNLTLELKDAKVSSILLSGPFTLKFSGNCECGSLTMTEDFYECTLKPEPDAVLVCGTVGDNVGYAERDRNEYTKKEEGGKTVFIGSKPRPEGNTEFYIYNWNSTDDGISTEKKDGCVASMTVAKEYACLVDGESKADFYVQCLDSSAYQGGSKSIILEDANILALNLIDSGEVDIEFSGTNTCGSLNAGAGTWVMEARGEDATFACDSVSGNIKLSGSLADTSSGKTVYKYKEPNPVYCILPDGTIATQGNHYIGIIQTENVSGFSYDAASKVVSMNNATADALALFESCTVRINGNNTCEILELSMEDDGKVTLEVTAGSKLTCGHVYAYPDTAIALADGVSKTTDASGAVVYSGEGGSENPPSENPPSENPPSENDPSEEVPTNTVVSNDSSISVAGAAEVLPTGTTMTSTPVAATAAAYTNAVVIVTNQVPDAAVDNVAVFELDLNAADGSAIHDLGGNKVAVTMPVPIVLSGNPDLELAVYRVNADGSLTRCDASVSGGTLTFYTDHFSTYIFVEVVKDEDDDDDDADNSAVTQDQPAAQAAGPVSPKTGESSMPMAATGMVLLLGAGVCMMLRRKQSAE